MPQIALVVYCCVVYWLFKKDKEIRPLSSNALWIPALLLAIIGSKPLSLWLSQLGFAYTRDDRGYVDQVSYGLLVVAALLVLKARKIHWKLLVSSNSALTLMYLFWLASCLWAPSGSDAFKRLFRDVGCVVVGMVFLTEKDPWEAIRVVFVRLAYVLLPLSIILSRYFPELGRSATRGGDAMYTGVASHKNTMGVIALVFGLLLFADLISILKNNHRRIDAWIRYGALAVCLWVLLMVDSKTSLLCLFLGCLLFWGAQRLARLRTSGQVVACIVTVILVAGLSETAFGVSTFVIEKLLGRETTLTGRTEIWAALRQAGTDPVLGVGYSAFWDTAAARIVDQRFPGGLVTAHNGFIETYLDGGIAGVSLLVLLLLTWLAVGIRGALSGTVKGQFALVIWSIAIIYNNSETSYFRIEPLWFTLLLISNQYRHVAQIAPALSGRPNRTVQQNDRSHAAVRLARGKSRPMRRLRFPPALGGK
jgi:exopolysaccharide production protein ExoQ